MEVKTSEKPNWTLKKDMKEAHLCAIERDIIYMDDKLSFEGNQKDTSINTTKIIPIRFNTRL